MIHRLYRARAHISLLLLSLAAQAYSFPCYITIIKDNCWTNYDVTVQVDDVMVDKPITSIVIPSGEAWTRYEFSCQEKQTLQFTAAFSPVIWDKDEDRKYKSKRFWSYPEIIRQGDTAWNMTVCYPQDFAEIPMPPDVSGACTCDKKIAPPVEER
jgi:hypothetical protein